MILFVDDETSRTRRWREALEVEDLGPVRCLDSADAALRQFEDTRAMAEVRLVILDLAMYTAEDMSEAETDLGRITGDALRRRLRATGWSGPVLILTHSRDDALRERVIAEGDALLRKPETPPSDLVRWVRERLERG